jgi:hypothetical protein
VMLEIYSDADLRAAAATGDRAATEARRMRTQGSLWMAMALDDQHAASVSYEHENLNNMLRLAPPSTAGGAMVSVALYLIREKVTPAWAVGVTQVGAEQGNRARDRLLVDEAHGLGIPVVSRDQYCHEYGAKQGVAVFTPETFAGNSGLSREAARQRFMARLHGAAREYVRQVPSGRDRERRSKAMQFVLRLFSAIWKSAGLLTR